MTVALLLAQEEQRPPGGLDLAMFLPFILIAVVFYFLLIRPRNKEQAERDAMLAALKKNDKVVTIGGMLGTIANITPDGNEVTLKVDDNTRIRMVRSSIQRVLSTDGDADRPQNDK